jgi:hypothetical protein
MRLFKNNKSTSINVVVVGHAQIKRRQTPTLDLASSTNNKHCLPTTTIINNNLANGHHHQHSPPSPPHTNADSPPPQRRPTPTPMAHTNQNDATSPNERPPCRLRHTPQRHVMSMTWHVNSTLRTCHDNDERRWLGSEGGDAAVYRR